MAGDRRGGRQAWRATGVAGNRRVVVAGDRRVVVAGDRLPRSKAASRCAISFIASAMILHRMLALGCLAVPAHAAAE